MVTDSKKAPDSVAPRKPYHAPMLTTYGTLGALTQALGGIGNNDGMSGAGMNSTSP